jgi:hypothetical protein
MAQTKTHAKLRQQKWNDKMYQVFRTFHQTPREREEETTMKAQ